MLLACSLCCASALAEVTGYSDEPIRGPVFEAAWVPYQTTAAAIWLGVAWRDLNASKYPAIREHLHALVDARVKDLYARQSSIVPREPDPVLGVLFHWAARVGVYGIDEAYRVVRDPHDQPPPHGPEPPRDVSLVLDGDLMRVTNRAQGWSFAVPYYFFIVGLSAGDANEPVAQIALGTTRDAAVPGFAQPTITLYRVTSSASGTAGAFLPGTNPAAEPHAVDPGATSMIREVRFVEARGGSIAVVYAGPEETYRWNRRHFLDFLSNLKAQL